MISPSRDAAFRILLKVARGGYASDLLRRESLHPRDAALAETIVLGCLRFQSQLDFLIANLAARPKLDDEVRIALRMGVYQLRYLDRIPAHAAVAESVELVKRAKKKSAAPFVNAVLRKVTRTSVTWPDLATELSVPAWILERWQQQYGPEIAAGIARAALEEPETPLNPATGRHQDIGAQSIVPLLDIHAGETLLDLCAAPGNKTAQALAAGARVIACDRYENRLAEVPQAASRVVLDASQALPFGENWVRFAKKLFAKILVDAPCSGTGTLARNPEIKWRLQPADLQRFQEMQRAILTNALAHLAPGGRLVYATCSLESEENEKIVEGLPVIATHTRLPGRDPGDGFFAAVIRPL